MAGRSRRRG